MRFLFYILLTMCLSCGLIEENNPCIHIDSELYGDFFRDQTKVSASKDEYSVFIEFKNSSCSGFYIGKQLIITAAHCLNNFKIKKDRISIKSSRELFRDDPRFPRVGIRINGNEVTSHINEIVFLGKSWVEDFAILRISKTDEAYLKSNGLKKPKLNLSCELPVQEVNVYCSFSHDDSLHDYYAFLSHKNPNEETLQYYDWVGLGGCSGAPIISDDSRVIGLHSSIFAKNFINIGTGIPLYLIFKKILELGALRDG